jgi:hypothetical protein
MNPLIRIFLTLLLIVSHAASQELRLSTFDLDATPPRGSRLAYDPMKEAGELTLRCRGIPRSPR